MIRGANRPFVTAHFAMTADGKTSTRAFAPAPFTSTADKLRADAVMAGWGTVAKGASGLLEGPALSGPTLARDDTAVVPPFHKWFSAGSISGVEQASRLLFSLQAGSRDGHPRSKSAPPGTGDSKTMAAEPLRVIVSNSGILDPGWKVFKYSGSPHVVFSTRRMPARVRSAVARKADLFLFSGSAVDLRKSLEILRAEFAVRQLVCEGGGTLLRSLASLDLVDRICLTIAPVIFGGRLAPTLTGLPGAFLDAPREFVIANKSVVSGECFLELRRKKCAA